MVLAWRHVPVCLIDRTVARLDYARAGVDIVRADNTDAAERLVSHLAAHGHRRIAVLSDPLHISTAADRLRGYREALKKACAELDPSLEVYGGFTIESGRAMAATLLERADPPTAIFAANNLQAIGALIEARQRGVRIPEDLALVSFDDIPQLETVTPFVTAAAQPASEIGRRAAVFLIERFARLSDAPRAGRELVIKYGDRAAALLRLRARSGGTLKEQEREAESTADEVLAPGTDAELLAECDVETFRAGGRGGQHVNTTESAVRLRHRPSGVVVTNSSERSQHRNKRAALEALRRKLERLARRRAPRIPTRATAASKRRTLEAKAKRSETKRRRAKPSLDD